MVLEKHSRNKMVALLVVIIPAFLGFLGILAGNKFLAFMGFLATAFLIGSFVNLPPFIWIIVVIAGFIWLQNLSGK